MNKKLVVSSGVLLMFLLIGGTGFIINKLSFDHSGVINSIQARIYNRVDVERLYEETPFIFEAGKELRLYAAEEYKDRIDETYAHTPIIKEAIDGDGGIIKNPHTSVFPYHFHFELLTSMHSSELNIQAKAMIRVAVLGELEADDKKRDSYFDVMLFVDDICYGIHRFETGKWGYSDWTNVPSGKLKLALYNPNEKNRIIGFGAIMTGD